MAKYEYLVIHCSATPEGRHVSAETIIDWHIKGRGWSRPGYSAIVEIDGSPRFIRDWDGDNWISDNEMTWGAKGINAKSRHMCYVGGVVYNEALKRHVPKDTRTDVQTKVLETLVLTEIGLHPEIKVIGHNQVAAKACPSFDVPSWLRSIGVDEKHIIDGKIN